MLVAKFKGDNFTEVRGVYQWDYGQEITFESAGVDIPDGTEVQFYQDELSHQGRVLNRHTLIPDIMLQEAKPITAYLYVRSESAGETILSVVIYVTCRPRPVDYVLPEYKDYTRLLPDGGKQGDVLTKQSDDPYDADWETSEQNMKPMTDEEIDAIFAGDLF